MTFESFLELMQPALFSVCVFTSLLLFALSVRVSFKAVIDVYKLSVFAEKNKNNDIAKSVVKELKKHD